VILCNAFVEVRKCRHKKTNEKRLVKIVRNDEGKNMLPGDEYQEFQRIKEIEHPGIVRVYDLWKYNRKYYIVTEYHKWKFLVEHFKEIKTLDEPSVG
jgi:calcium-dependent protein kinase